MRPSGIKPQPGKIADIFIISPVQITELLFHDPNQAAEYGENYGQTPSPGQMEIAESNREMAVRLGWNPCLYDPRFGGRLGHPRRGSVGLRGFHRPTHQLPRCERECCPKCKPG